MDERKNTYCAISDALKELLAANDFSKITISMITSKAGIKRSTFYNYFQDKYSILEWILKNDLYENAKGLIGKKMYHEAFRLMFACIEENRVFYSKAFDITGQNAFEDIFANELCKILLEVYGKFDFNSDNPVYNRRNIADYQARATVMYIKMWIHDNLYSDATYIEVCDAYIMMLLQGSKMVSDITSLSMIFDFAHEKITSPLKKLPEIISKHKKTNKK